jgi:hypothetical protein
MKPAHLRKHVIIPTLNYLGLRDPDAEDLLVGVACAETNCGDYLSQLMDGPALGIYQCEPASLYETMQYLLTRRTTLYQKVMSLSIPELSIEDNVRGNLFFATAIARCFFLRFPEPIPQTAEGKAAYWKKYYNTNLGAGTIDGFLRKWKEKEEGTY